MKGEKDVTYLFSPFIDTHPLFYFVKVYDETTLEIDIDDYLLDESLKGEYVRQGMADASVRLSISPAAIPEVDRCFPAAVGHIRARIV